MNKLLLQFTFLLLLLAGSSPLFSTTKTELAKPPLSENIDLSPATLHFENYAGGSAVPGTNYSASQLVTAYRASVTSSIWMRTDFGFLRTEARGTFSTRDPYLDGSGILMEPNGTPTSRHKAQAKVTFTKPVYNLKFVVTDVDGGNGASPESFEIIAYFQGSIITLSPSNIRTISGPLPTQSGNYFTGEGAGGSNVFEVSYSTPVDKVLFKTGITTDAADTRVAVKIFNFHFDIEQDPPVAQTPWSCTSDFYQMVGTSIKKLNTTGSYSHVTSLSNASFAYAPALSPADGKLYAISNPDGITQLSVINPDGVVVGTELNTSSSYTAGAIASNNTMFLLNSSGGLSKIDLNSQSSIVSVGSLSSGVQDLTYSSQNNRIYGFTGSQLYSISPSTGSVSTSSISGAPGGTYGSIWSSSDGLIYAYHNSSGEIYAIDPSTREAMVVLNSTSNLSSSGGFNCSPATAPIEGRCNDGIDNDGDGQIDCLDGNCNLSGECITEDCFNGIDDDGDGYTDCEDNSCFTTVTACTEICGNGIDDNGNGLVDEEDPQCSSSAAYYAGLESNNRLSDLITQRSFKRSRYPDREDYEKTHGLRPVDATINRSNQALDLLLPANLGDLKSTDGTPSDLAEVTNANRVVGRDYFMNSTRVAGILAIESSDAVYEHTKYICDRLGGARLVDVGYTSFGNGHLMKYELITKNGQREYSASFSAYLEEDKYAVESYWNLSDYSPNKDYHNIQVWAHSEELLNRLLSDIYQNMTSLATRIEVSAGIAPKLYISNGKYENGTLQLLVHNFGREKQVEINGTVRRSEHSAEESVSYFADLTGNPKELLQIPTGHVYDLSLGIWGKGLTSDELFLADGRWFVEDHDQQQVALFQSSPQASLPHDAKDAYLLERSIEMEAQVQDYINVSRAISPKFEAVDLSKFHNLAMTIAAEGEVTITIVKAGIEAWENQFSTTIRCTGEPESIVLDKSSFRSKQGDALALNDVVRIVFSIRSSHPNQTKTLSISNLRFTNEEGFDYSTIKNTSKLVTKVTPSLVQDQTRIVSSESIQTIEVISAEGKVVGSHRIGGQRSHTLVVYDIPTGVYFLRIISDSGEEGFEKIVKMQ